MTITRTPVHISFAGGGTDYPVWNREHSGSVLSTTIDKSCYIERLCLRPIFEYHSRPSYSKVESVNRNRQVEHSSLRACLDPEGIDGGVEFHQVADLPARTGLGSSSVLTVGAMPFFVPPSRKEAPRLKAVISLEWL
jgi:D-glycero-alpha-D-manno-heptose-7-phosphate kinase